MKNIVKFAIVIIVVVLGIDFLSGGFSESKTQYNDNAEDINSKGDDIVKEDSLSDKGYGFFNEFVGNLINNSNGEVTEESITFIPHYDIEGEGISVRMKYCSFNVCIGSDNEHSDRSLYFRDIESDYNVNSEEYKHDIDLILASVGTQRYWISINRLPDEYHDKWTNQIPKE